jgi:GT2 family glycosyltransferase
MVEHYDMLFGFPQARYVEAGFGATANVFTRREVLERVGRFRPELHSGGDQEWGQRVRDAGYRLLYVESARVDHPARRSWSELIRKTTRTNRGMFELSRLQGKGRGHTLRLVMSDLRPPVGWMVRLLRRRGAASLRATLSALAVLMFNRWLRAWVWISLEARSVGRRSEVGRTGL